MELTLTVIVAVATSPVAHRKVAPPTPILAPAARVVQVSQVYELPAIEKPAPPQHGQDVDHHSPEKTIPIHPPLPKHPKP